MLLGAESSNTQQLKENPFNSVVDTIFFRDYTIL